MRHEIKNIDILPPLEAELVGLILRHVAPCDTVLVRPPPLSTVGPGQILSDSPEAGADVDDAVSHDDVVVDRDDGAEDEHGDTDPGGYGGTSPDLQGTQPGKLSDGRLHVVHGLSHQDQDDEVGDEEGTTTIFIGEVGKPPDLHVKFESPFYVIDRTHISYAHGVTDTGK